LEELMKKVVYGTVSALALMLAVTGVARAENDSIDGGNFAAAASLTANSVSGNASALGLIKGDNEIDAFAFEHAAGAFNVGQNQSVNSSVQQSMSIAAVISRDVSDSTQGDDQKALSASVGLSRVSGNRADLQDLDVANELEAHAFENAKGAFNVLQNESVNSGVSQSMSIAAIVSKDDREPDAAFENAGIAVSVLASATTGNAAAFTDLGAGFRNTNQITDNAFRHASGAFNVLQNASINSSVQQGMAIGAVVNK
jgi:hypothetical protein